MPDEIQIQLLQSYDWPCNIRELGAVIDRAAILGNGTTLELAAALGVGAPRAARPLNSEMGAGTPPLNRRPGRIATLNEAMRSHIEMALRATHGRVEGARGAARLLQINPHTLRARMRKLGVDWAAFREPAEDAEIVAGTLRVP
jgi:DNA-binding NtrC family response regulator